MLQGPLEEEQEEAASTRWSYLVSRVLFGVSGVLFGVSGVLFGVSGVQIFEGTKINHDIQNYEETRHGYMHKTWIRNLELDAARVIFFCFSCDLLFSIKNRKQTHKP